MEWYYVVGCERAEIGRRRSGGVCEIGRVSVKERGCLCGIVLGVLETPPWRVVAYGRLWDMYGRVPAANGWLPMTCET